MRPILLITIVGILGCKQASKTTEAPPPAPAPKTTEPAMSPPAPVAPAKTVPNAVPPNAQKPGVSLARQQCEAKEVQGCVALSGLLPYPSPEQEAASAAACDLGSMAECNALGGHLAMDLEGDDARHARGFALLERACDAGYGKGEACDTASVLMTKDRAKAKALKAKACAQGIIQGCPCTSTAQCGDNEGLICEKHLCVTAEVQ